MEVDWRVRFPSSIINLDLSQVEIISGIELEHLHAEITSIAKDILLLPKQLQKTSEVVKDLVTIINSATRVEAYLSQNSYSVITNKILGFDVESGFYKEEWIYQRKWDVVQQFLCNILLEKGEITKDMAPRYACNISSLLQHLFPFATSHRLDTYGTQ